MAFSFNAQNLLNGPQKIILDKEHNRYLVSNFNTGDIIQIDSFGNQDYFVQAANFFDGLEIVGDTVFGIGQNRKITAYNLTTKQLVMGITLPGSTNNYLSSITSDSAGHLFISCPALNTIYKFRISDQAYWVFAENNGLNRPNGILLEKENNRIVVIDDSPNNSTIHAISLSDSTVSDLMTNNFNCPDGIIRDNNGFYYVGGYYLPGLYRIDPDFSGEPELFFESSHLIYPTYYETNNSILVTLYGDGDWAEIPVEENVLDEPESIVYDSVYNRYLVSSCGHGKIIQIDHLGQQSYFNTATAYTLGLHIVDNMVFVSSNDGPVKGVAGMSLLTRGIEFHAEIPEQELLNDITADTSGNLYITDCDANKIYKVNIENSTHSTFVSSGLGYPNGLLFDELNNRLLVSNCILGGYPITAVDLEDSTVTMVVNTNISSVDGLTTDNYGNTYFSSWVTDKTYRYDETFTNPPEVVTEGHTDPADIFYNKQADILAVPNYSSNVVEFIPITPTGIKEVHKKNLKMNSITPNPFIDAIKIEFSLSEYSRVNIDVHNISGKKILDLTDKGFNSGIHTIEWNGSCTKGAAIQPGTYFIEFLTNNNKKVFKVIKQ